jgi:hypothetical protein
MCCDIYAAMHTASCIITPRNQESVDAAVATLVDAAIQLGRCSDSQSSCYSVCEEDEFLSGGKCVPCKQCSDYGLFTLEKCTRLKDAVCQSLSAAIETWAEDTMVLKKGVYSGAGTCGAVLRNRKSLTIQGLYGVSDTVIDCTAEPAPVRHFDVQGGSTLVLTGITLLYGGSDSVSHGGCISVTEGSSLVMSHVVVSGCSAQYGGGVHALGGSIVTIGTGTVLSDNTAIETGGCVYGEMRVL